MIKKVERKEPVLLKKTALSNALRTGTGNFAFDRNADL